MALRKQNFPLRFTQGIDSANDPKSVIPSKFTGLQNLEWDTADTFRQRPGYTRATLTATGIPVVSVANIKALHDLGSELLIEAASGMHLFLRDRTVSVENDLNDTAGTVRAHERAQVDYVDIGAGSPMFESSALSQFSFDAAAAGASGASGMECWVWTTQIAGFNVLFYKVIDRFNNSTVQSGRLDPGAVDCYNPRVIAVDSAGNATAFMIYFAQRSGGVNTIRMRSMVVAAGTAFVAAAPSAAVTVVTPTAIGAAPPFDVWHDNSVDRYFIAYEDNATTGLALSVLSANGFTVLFTTVGAHLVPLNVSVTSITSGGVVYGLAVYHIGTNALYALSMTSGGASALATTLDTPTMNGKERIGVIVSPFDSTKAMVFYDTTPSTDIFPSDIRYLRCDKDGANPTSISTFARGVVLAARPVAYDAVGDGVLDVCVPAALLSSLQSTVFALKFGGPGPALSGFDALASHKPPRAIGRFFPSECGDLRSSLAGTLNVRLPTPLAAI